MEPHTSTAYIDVQGRLTVISSTQNPFHTRRIIGEALSKPLRDIRIIKPRIGGGFGAKTYDVYPTQELRRAVIVCAEIAEGVGNMGGVVKSWE